VVVCVFAIQTLTCSTAIGGNNSPAGAEFLKNVIGNLPKLTRKIINDRIDVEEYIPDDVPYPNHGNDIQMLSKLPIGYGQNVRESTHVQYTHVKITEDRGVFNFFPPQNTFRSRFTFVVTILTESSERQQTPIRIVILASVGNTKQNCFTRTAIQQFDTAKHNRCSFG